MGAQTSSVFTAGHSGFLLATSSGHSFIKIQTDKNRCCGGSVFLVEFCIFILLLPSETCLVLFLSQSSVHMWTSTTNASVILLDIKFQLCTYNLGFVLFY